MKNKKINTKKSKESVELNVEKEYWTEITYTCPKRGKVTEKVKVKRIKSPPIPSSVNQHDAELIQTILGMDDEET